MSTKKGYWIALIDVADQENYKRYIAASTAALGKHGGRPIVRAGDYEQPEGFTGNRHVVIEFASYAAALACYRSPDYQEALKLRAAYSTGNFVIVEGA